MYIETENFIITKFLSSEDFEVTEDLLEIDQLVIIFDKIDKMLDPTYTLKKNAVSVTLFIPNMENFPQINKIYANYFSLKPPVRACVALPYSK